jgi:hypothetical protein
MPLPDYPIKVINGQNGYARDNKSWVLGRLVRDYKYWMNKKVKEEVKALIDMKDAFTASRTGQPIEQVQRSKQAGLCISIYKAREDKRSGDIGLNRYDALAWAVALVQLAIASIPCIIWGAWGVLLVTGCGILLTTLTASLTQWRTEKWACRRLEKDKTVILTTGNGSQHAIVILAGKGFINMEDLANGDSDSSELVGFFTRVRLFVLAVLWVLLLITAAGIDNDTWFLLAIGGIGIVQNVVTAGWPRPPESVGFHLQFVECFAEIKVMGALQIAELRYPGIGKCLRDTYFPASVAPPTADRKAEDDFFQNPALNKVSIQYEDAQQQKEWLTKLNAAIRARERMLQQQRAGTP